MTAARGVGSGRFPSWGLAAMLGAAMAGSAGAAEPSSLALRAQAATCAACHGTDGRAVAGEPMVALAGLPKDAITGPLRAFRDGQRPATVMHQIAKGYTDLQIDQLAAYFAAQRP